MLVAPLLLLQPPPPPPCRCAAARLQFIGEEHAAAEANALTEANVRHALDEFEQAAPSMFGRHAACAAVSITGAISLRELDGPVAVVDLRGRFWHRRATVLRNADVWLRKRWPELVAAEVADAAQLDDVRIDETADGRKVRIDLRSPDFDGNRGTLEYQGIDPDTRGPFHQPSGGFRAGGSIYS